MVDETRNRFRPVLFSAGHRIRIADVKTINLPPAYQRRFAQVVALIEDQNVQPAAIGGKILQRFPNVLSVPLGRRYRLLFRKTPMGFRFHACLSHEAYNHLITGRSLRWA